MTTDSKDLMKMEEGNNQTSTANTASVPLVVEYPEVKIKFSEESVMATCPYCHQSMVTDLESESGPFTFLSAIILAHCLLCWIPFIVDRFKDMKHSCPKCKSTIGIFKRL